MSNYYNIQSTWPPPKNKVFTFLDELEASEHLWIFFSKKIYGKEVDLPPCYGKFHKKMFFFIETFSKPKSLFLEAIASLVVTFSLTHSLTNLVTFCKHQLTIINMSSTLHSHVIHMSSTCHPHVIRMSSTCHSHVIHMSFTCHPYVIHMLSTCHHIIHMPFTCHPHVIRISFTCHPHVINK